MLLLSFFLSFLSLLSTNPEPQGRFLRLPEAADYLGDGVSVLTLRDWIRQGLLPAHRLGKRLIQVHTDDLDALRRPIPTAPKRSATPSKRKGRRT